MKDDHDHLVPVAGERGPKGDHGQSGDLGDTGIRGIQGDVGERGDRGERGHDGERGPKGDTGQIQRVDLPDHFVRWILLATVAGAVAMFLVPYGAAVKTRDTLVRGCEASKVDRTVNANSWEKARARAEASVEDPASSAQQRKVSRAAEATYVAARDRNAERGTLVGMDRAVRRAVPAAGSFVCGEAFPKPSLLPF